jgi:hypothetical protein
MQPMPLTWEIQLILPLVTPHTQLELTQLSMAPTLVLICLAVIIRLVMQPVPLVQLVMQLVQLVMQPVQPLVHMQLVQLLVHMQLVQLLVTQLVQLLVTQLVQLRVMQMVPFTLLKILEIGLLECVLMHKPLISLTCSSHPLIMMIH